MQAHLDASNAAPASGGCGREIRRIAAVLLGALACSTGDGASQATPGASTLAHGERLFLGSCAGYCHSPAYGGRGDAPDLFDCVWVYGATDEAILRSITQGVPGSDMPGFADTLSGVDRRLLVAWLRAESRCETAAP